MTDPATSALADLTLELVRVPSVTGEEAALCACLAPRLERAFPGQVRRIGNSFVAGRLDDPRPLVGLFGHLDTVPPHAGDEARLEGGIVYGTGSSDMKSGVAVMLALAADLDLARLPVALALVLYDCEEGPFENNGLAHVLHAMPDLSRCALAFCLESTDLEAQLGCLGSLHAAVTFHGKRAHSARPWQGENAITKAVPLLAELAARAPRDVLLDGLVFREVISPTTAHGGRARNVVPDAFELNLNYRFAPDKTVAEAEAALAALVAGRAEVHVVDRAPAARPCATNPHFRRFAELTGVKVGPKQAWTDVARLAAAGIDAVNFGPGLTAQAHQAGEHVPVENLAAAYRMLRLFVTSPAP